MIDNIDEQDADQQNIMSQKELDALRSSDQSNYKIRLDENIDLFVDSVKNPDKEHKIFNYSIENIIDIIKKNNQDHSLGTHFLQKEAFIDGIVETFTLFYPESILINLCKLLQYLSKYFGLVLTPLFSPEIWYSLKERIDSPTSVFSFTYELQKGRIKLLEPKMESDIRLMLLSVVGNLLIDEIFDFNKLSDIWSSLWTWFKIDDGAVKRCVLRVISAFVKELISHCNVEPDEFDEGDDEEEEEEKDEPQQVEDDSQIRELLSSVPPFFSTYNEEQFLYLFNDYLNLYQSYLLLKEFSDNINKFLLVIISFINDHQNDESISEEIDLDKTKKLIMKSLRNLYNITNIRRHINSLVDWNAVYDFVMNTSDSSTRTDCLYCICEIICKEERSIETNSDGEILDVFESIISRLIIDFSPEAQINDQKLIIFTINQRISRDVDNSNFLRLVLDTDLLDKFEGIALSDSNVSVVFVHIFDQVIKYLENSPALIEQYRNKIESNDTLYEIVNIDDDEFEESAEMARSILERLEPIDVEN